MDQFAFESVTKVVTLAFALSELNGIERHFDGSRSASGVSDGESPATVRCWHCTRFHVCSVRLDPLTFVPGVMGAVQSPIELTTKKSDEGAAVILIARYFPRLHRNPTLQPRRTAAGTRIC